MKDPAINLANVKVSDLRSAKKEWSRRVLQTPRVQGMRAFATASGIAPAENVVGVGVGEQIVDNKPTGLLAVKFFVRVKYAKRELSRKNMLPKQIDGLMVNVEETGLFRRLAAAKPAQAAGDLPNPKTKIRPAQPGCSVGYQDPANQIVMAGTFGALVKNGSGSYILSNNHVLADEGRLSEGAPIFQPGLLDGGNVSTD